MVTLSLVFDEPYEADDVGDGGNQLRGDEKTGSDQLVRGERCVHERRRRGEDRTGGEGRGEV